jgi:predicted methyltransferase
MYRYALVLASLLVAAPPQAADIPANIAAAVASPERSAKDRARRGPVRQRDARQQ